MLVGQPQRRGMAMMMSKGISAHEDVLHET